MNKQTAIKEFKDFVLPHLPKKDKPALDQAWNDWTDALCKEGEITSKQYETWVNPF